MSWYEAGVQYNDYKGTAAADRADMESLRKYLVSENLADEDENVVGFRIVFSENSGREIEKPGIVVYLNKAKEFQPSPAKIRAVETNLKTSELFKYLKRFDMVVLNKGMDFSSSKLEGPFTD